MNEIKENEKFINISKYALPKSDNIKSRVRHVLRNIMLTTLCMIPQKDNGNFLRLIYCHYVFDDQKEKFREIMKSLQSKGTFINTDLCVSMIKGNTPIDGKYYHLSFDDGFRNIYQNAFPMLKELQIPFIIFVPTSIIEADWQTVKNYSLVTTRNSGVIELMSWNELNEIISSGVEIGSHTRTHKRFSSMNSDEEFLNEILGSKMDIENKLGVDCKYISWPYGTLNDINNKSLKATRNAGYEACFGAFRSSIYNGDTIDCFIIPRHHFEVHWPISHIEYFASGKMEHKVSGIELTQNKRM